MFAYGLYAVMAALSFLFVATMIPETKGRELEDMSDAAHTRAPRVTG